MKPILKNVKFTQIWTYRKFHAKYQLPMLCGCGGGVQRVGRKAMMLIMICASLGKKHILSS